MASNLKKKYTVADVYREAGRMLKEELRDLKKGDLSKTEEIKMEKLGRILSTTVLREMKAV